MIAAAPLQKGELFQARVFDAIRQADLVEYAYVSSDNNPIHLSTEAAKQMGLPGTIAHGMLIASFIAESAREWLDSRVGAGVYRILHCSTRFRNMTLVGESLTVRGSVKSADGETSAIIELEARNEKAELKATASYRIDFNV